MSLSVGPICGTWRVGPSIGIVENLLKEGSGYGASLCMGALIGEPGGGALSLRAWKVYGRKALGSSISQLGKLERAHLLGTLRYGCKGLRRWIVSLCGSSVKGT
jgi:hypothetical protein